MHFYNVNVTETDTFRYRPNIPVAATGLSAFGTNCFQSEIMYQIMFLDAQFSDS